MVGSTVYGFENELYQIVALLQTLGYEVLNSHVGTIKVNPKLSNLENCLNAVDECDLFLGIIRPYYGTGIIGEKNIVRKNNFFDPRCIDVYNYVIKNHIPITLRNGNWAQEFYRLDEMSIYIKTQFEDRTFIENILAQED